ncbi:hypothetical protein Misp04_05200 [Micromonospora sp. NBRC 101691]|nr:hypothetical protein Misp04_05200 [Micromonospora sp. NBRC 101691]
MRVRNDRVRQPVPPCSEPTRVAMPVVVTVAMGVVVAMAVVTVVVVVHRVSQHLRRLAGRYPLTAA